MNKRLVMWGTFLAVFLVSIVGSYKFINRNSQDMTIELGAPTLPLVHMVLGEEHYNTLHGYTGNMVASEVAQYIYPLGSDRTLQASVDTFGEKIKAIGYEIRNTDGSRLIESGEVVWKETTGGILDFSVKMKDLIVSGEEYLVTFLIDTDSHKDVRYYTRFVYGTEFDLDNQLAFVKAFHAMTFDKESVTEIAAYMETDHSLEHNSLAYVDISSTAKQVVWDELPVERVSEPEVQITYLQDNFGAYTLDYYVKSQLDVTEYYHVVENFLVSSYGEKLYLLDYERTADTIFRYETDVYHNDKIYLSIQSRDIPVVESEDGNMAAFVVNSSLYYYDDVENDINYVYGFFDDINADSRSMYFAHDIKVLKVSSESGSMYFAVYGYMNRGNYEGKTGVALYSYNGQTKLIEEIGFYESTHSPAYVMQEMEELSFFSRDGKFYMLLDGNIVSYDTVNDRAQVEIPYKEDQQLFISKDHSCLVVEDAGDVDFWYLETGYKRRLSMQTSDVILPQGFIGTDFVYGIFEQEDGVLQSDGTYAQYMKEIRIQSAQGEILKEYRSEDAYITECNISGNQILLERVKVQNGRMTAAAQEQIVASKAEEKSYNETTSALTDHYQTIWQIELKNKMDIATLEHKKAKEVFQEISGRIEIATDSEKSYVAVCNPWRVVEYTRTAADAMVRADILEGYALDESGAVIWKKAATVTKNQIMAIELENATDERSSKEICLDIMLRQIGSPKDVEAELAEGKNCQQILTAEGDYVFMDITGSSLEAMLYYINQDIPIMVLYEDGEAVLITGFNQFNIVVMDPVKKKLGYMSRSDAKKMLEETKNQVFTYYHREIN